MGKSDMKPVRDVYIGDKVLPTGSRTCIMGILNVTPDSFSDGGEFTNIETAVKRVRQMIEEGADIIDIGGESSRPGASPVSLEEEIKRVIPVVSAVVKHLDVIVSVDTYKSEVARRALEEGADIINDITALFSDDKMASTIADFNAGVVLMHMKGSPETMQNDPFYEDVIDEISLFFRKSIEKAINSGIEPNKIIIDPGIGFGKDLKNNLKILKELDLFQKLGKPILIGTSRKSFIGDITGKNVKEREFGTAATLSAGILNGADIIRVHNVKDMVDVSRVTDAIRGEKCLS